jgi:hypothetical protein
VAQNVLDLIDNVIDAYESSPDAMRWSPDAPTPPSEWASGGWVDPAVWQRAAIRDETHHWVDLTPFVASIDVTDWQADILGRLPTGSLTLNFRRVLGASLNEFGEVPWHTDHAHVAIGLCADHWRARREQAECRRARLSRMHSLYHRRKS